MLKILQAKLQQYMNWEFPDVQVGFRKKQKNQDHSKSKRVPEKTSTSTSERLLLCGSQQTVENSSRDGNTRPPNLPT